MESIPSTKADGPESLRLLHAVRSTGGLMRWVGSRECITMLAADGRFW